MEKGVLIDDNLWFDWLQDSGFIETPKAKRPNAKNKSNETQKPDTPKPKKLKSKPTKPKHISYNMRLHPKLYSLAMEVVKVATTMDIPAFPRLPDIKSNNISKTYHYIGEWIAGTRKMYKRADIHNIGASSDLVNDMINEEKYLSTEKFYVLSQDDVFKHVFEKYGPKESTTSEYTVDDFVRVMGVIFNDELLREYLPDMVGSTKSGNRNEMDGSRSGARSGFRRLWGRFIDREVVVTLPKLWGTTESIARLELRTPGAFEQHGRFNPNNLQRIELAWQEKDLISLFRHVLSLYNQCMHFYTMGTGGGPGYPENFNNWQARDSEWVAMYLNDQKCNLFLTVIHMWDKQHKFPMVKIVGSVPPESQIDDCIDGSGGGEEDNFRIHKPSTPYSSARKNREISDALSTMASQRQSVAANSAEMTASIQRLEKMVTTSSTTGSGTTRVVVDDLNVTEDSIERFEGKIKKLKRKRKKAGNNSRKVAQISSQISRYTKIVAGLETAMDKFSAGLSQDVGEENVDMPRDSIEEENDDSDDSGSRSDNSIDEGEDDSDTDDSE